MGLCLPTFIFHLTRAGLSPAQVSTSQYLLLQTSGSPDQPQGRGLIAVNSEQSWLVLCFLTSYSLVSFP